MENQSNLGETLTDAIKDMARAIEDLGKALKDCRQAGMSETDIRDMIMLNIPEDERASFLQQWPMLSMMFAVL